MDACRVIIALLLLAGSALASDADFYQAIRYKRECEQAYRSALETMQPPSGDTRAGRAVADVMSALEPLTPEQKSSLLWSLWSPVSQQPQENQQPESSEPPPGAWTTLRLLGVSRPVGEEKLQLTSLRIEFGPYERTHAIVVSEQGQPSVLRWFEQQLLSSGAKLTISERIIPQEEAFFASLEQIGLAASDPEFEVGLEIDPNAAADSGFFIVARGEPCEMAFPGQARRHRPLRVARQLPAGYVALLPDLRRDELLTLGEEGLAATREQGKGQPAEFRIWRYHDGAYQSAFTTRGRSRPAWANVADRGPVESTALTIVAALAATNYWRERGYHLDPGLWIFPNR